MGVFEYEAVDGDGQPCIGTMEADSRYRVAVSLCERGFRVSSIRERGKQRGFFRGPRPLTLEDLTLLNEQLLEITESRLPLASALDTMAKDVKSKRLRAVIEDIGRELEAGATIEAALRRHPESFSPAYLAMIQAGEHTGNLPGVLAQLTTHSKQMVEFKNGLQEALAYPIVAFTVVTLLFGFLCVMVVPAYAEIYAMFGKRLPLPTWPVLFMGRLLSAHASCLLAGAGFLILAVCLLRKLLRGETFRRSAALRLCERLKLHAPVVGRLCYTSRVERFARTLGVLLSSRAEAPESLILAGASTGSAVFEQAGLDAATRVANGETMADALEGVRLFRPRFLWLLRHGEKNGAADNAFLSLADACERELARRTKLAVMLAGPIGISLIGLIVFFTALSILIPVFQLSSVVGG
ncbi:MAG TPA: type II secretion system F family protein [Candidatus Hydrogenedentes bacterium]|nr:type II secretion system F family protein [Candidatus Hydrogenedentota bacterium]HIJ74517.1 type II secretion system F family protein [Candidatus Hydrogenedentota bacterium]